MAGAGGKLDDREAAPLELVPEAPRAACAAIGTGSSRKSARSSSAATRRSRRSRSGARASTETAHAAGDDVRRARLDVELTDGGRRLRRRQRSRSRTRRTYSAAAISASRRPAIGTVPAWPALARRRSLSPRTMPTMPMASPSGAPARSRTGPCSTCTSRKHSGSGPRSTKAELPTQPRSSSRKTATAPFPTRSTASIAATTPSAPSNLPPKGTESRCEPVQTLDSRRRPIRFPAASTSTSSPASRIQPAASSCARSSPAVPATRLAPTPPPMA